MACGLQDKCDRLNGIEGSPGSTFEDCNIRVAKEVMTTLWKAKGLKIPYRNLVSSHTKNHKHVCFIYIKYINIIYCKKIMILCT